MSVKWGAASAAVIYPSGRRRGSTPPQPNLSPAPSFMSAEPAELLWETHPSSPTATTSKPLTTTATIGSSSTGVSASAVLECAEDSILLDDWDETQEDTDPEHLDQIPDSARALMDARMEAPQNSLDGSSASHSWEHPARVEKRKRVFSYVWADRPLPKSPVGNFNIFIMPFIVLKR